MRGVVLVLALAACADESNKLGDWGFVFPYNTDVVSDRDGGFATLVMEAVTRFDQEGNELERVPRVDPKAYHADATFDASGTLYTLDMRWEGDGLPSSGFVLHTFGSSPAAIELDLPDDPYHVVTLLSGSSSVLVERNAGILEEFAADGTPLGSRAGGEARAIDEMDNFVMASRTDATTVSLAWTNASRETRWMTPITASGLYVEVSTIAFVADGSVAIAGNVQGTSLVVDTQTVPIGRPERNFAFVAELDPLGHVRWVHTFADEREDRVLVRVGDRYAMTRHGYGVYQGALRWVDANGIDQPLPFEGSNSIITDLHRRGDDGVWTEVQIAGGYVYGITVGEQTVRGHTFLIDLDAALR